MDQKEIDYAVISNALELLSVMCVGNKDKVVDLLTGYLWDEEEAGRIKNSDGKRID